GLERNDSIEVPERHLGLVQAGELGGVRERLRVLGDSISAAVNLDALCRSARPAAAREGLACSALPAPPGQRIAVAHDRAFSFMYPHMLSAWRAAGADILPFS